MSATHEGSSPSINYTYTSSLISLLLLTLSGAYHMALRGSMHPTSTSMRGLQLLHT